MMSCLYIAGINCVCGLALGSFVSVMLLWDSHDELAVVERALQLSHGVRSGIAMASIRLQPPEPFDFKRPDEWPRWKKRFAQFRSASTLDKEAEDRQVNTLLYCMGEEAENVLSSTGISDKDKKNYDKVVEKFDLYFAVRRNVIFERARFNRRVQYEGESAETYISELYELIEFCDYGNLKDEMLRDRLVVGIRDTSLSEKMQTDLPWKRPRP